MAKEVLRPTAPVVLASGREYLIHALSLRDMESLNCWVRMTLLERYANSLPESFPDDRIDRMLEKKAKELESYVWHTGPGKKVGSSPTGILRVFWQMLAEQRKPDFLPFHDEIIDDKINLKRNLEAMRRGFKIVNNVPEGLIPKPKKSKGKSKSNSKQSQSKKSSGTSQKPRASTPSEPQTSPPSKSGS